MSEYFPKPLGLNLKAKLDLFNYVTRTNLKKKPVLINQILLKRVI